LQEKEDSEIESAAKVVDDNLTLSMVQFECLVSDLKTKHLAEMRMI